MNWVRFAVADGPAGGSDGKVVWFNDGRVHSRKCIPPRWFPWLPSLMAGGSVEDMMASSRGVDPTVRCNAENFTRVEMECMEMV